MTFAEFQRWAKQEWGFKVPPPTGPGSGRHSSGSRLMGRILDLEAAGHGRPRTYTLKHQRRLAMYLRIREVMGFSGGWKGFPEWLEPALLLAEIAEDGQYVQVTKYRIGWTIRLVNEPDWKMINRTEGVLWVPVRKER